MNTAREAGDEDPTKVVGRRCVQFLLDAFLVTVPTLVIVFGGAVLLFRWGVEHLGLRGFADTVAGTMLGLFVIGVVTVQLWWPHRHGGRTPAMQWLGLRIVTTEGTAPRASLLLVRVLLQVVDGFLFCLVGLVLMLVSARHQRFADMVAGTFVVRDRR